MVPTDFDTALAQDRLKSLLHYDAETGVFTRKCDAGPAKAGSVAGCLHKATGYHLIKVDGRAYTASRLAWLYMTGDWPPSLIDHKDLDRANNAWSNLRAASHAENNCNRRAAQGKDYPLKGVYRRKDTPRSKPWTAKIRLGGKLRNLGDFSNPEEAHAAYQRAAVAGFGSFARA